MSWTFLIPCSYKEVLQVSFMRHCEAGTPWTSFVYLNLYIKAGGAVGKREGEIGVNQNHLVFLFLLFTLCAS